MTDCFLQLMNLCQLLSPIIITCRLINGPQFCICRQLVIIYFVPADSHHRALSLVVRGTPGRPLHYTSVRGIFKGPYLLLFHCETQAYSINYLFVSGGNKMGDNKKSNMKNQVRNRYNPGKLVSLEGRSAILPILLWFLLFSCGVVAGCHMLILGMSL